MANDSVAVLGGDVRFDGAMIVSICQSVSQDSSMLGSGLLYPRNSILRHQIAFALMSGLSGLVEICSMTII